MLSLVKHMTLLGLGAFCLIFGVVPSFFGVWHIGTLALVLAGMGCLFLLFTDGWNRHIWKIARINIAFFLGLGGLVGLILSIWMVSSAFWNPPPAEKPVTVLILGCQVMEDQPSLMLRYRLEAALTYLNDHQDTPVIVSGGYDPQNSFSEAQVMAAYLQSHGIKKQDIYLEDRSSSTQENITFSAQIQREQNLSPSFAIATDGFHQLRASLYAKDQGLEVYSLPAKTPWGLAPGYWVREWFGVLKALFWD